MACARLAAAFAAALAVALPAASAQAVPAGPQNLHPFMLRADSAAVHTFSRTPSFAWNPIRGAKTYEFELSTSKRFSVNGMVWSSSTIKSPATALPLSLPWITGKPYSLYAHVRAVTNKGTTAWSQPYGFNMRWPDIPTPLTPSYPGLLRWSKVPGADGYMVWLLDNANHWFSTRVNMADEREYYTFHQDPAWSGVVHWRVRAYRWLYGQTDNGLPAVSMGPWSQVYTSFNPPFATGPINSLKTVSDVVSDASHVATHEVTPAFVWNGNTSIWNTVDELYRVAVYTDEDCLNNVFNGAVVGSPAYVPREVGPLALPASTSGITSARSSSLSFGPQPDSETRDGIPVKTNEMDVVSSSSPGATGLPPGMTVTPAKVDLWDSDWAGGQYYWTVMPVNEAADDVLNTTLAAPTIAGDTTVALASATGVGGGDTLKVGLPPAETAVVKSVSGNLVTLVSGLSAAHDMGDPVVRPAGGVSYVDDELAQDSCASGRVGGFAKTSDPAVTGESGVPFASGLSPDGKLIGARKASPKFYGQPLVTWQPVPAANQYEVQWSKKAYPWTSAGSQITSGTAATLPLTPGTWFYRVRGIDGLMMGTKSALSWSDPVRLVVTKPRFKVIH
jgi:hypothetical protein